MCLIDSDFLNNNDTKVKLCFLKKLQISGNNFETLPCEMLELKLLTILDMDYSWKYLEIPKFVYQIRSLQRLSLNGNNMEIIPKDIINLINLRKLNLNQNHFENYIYKALYQASTIEIRTELKLASFIEIFDKINEEKGYFEWFEATGNVSAIFDNFFRNAAATVIQKHVRGVLTRNACGIHNPYCQMGKIYITNLFLIQEDEIRLKKRRLMHVDN
jgi:Leucine-rich repeat (LRR) protein